MITLFLGGANSGKSLVAERCASAMGPSVTYLATWRPASTAPPDAGMAERIARHRARRSPDWATRELGLGESLAQVLETLEGIVLVDALGTWVAGAPEFAVDVAALCSALLHRTGPTVVVSDEVGLGVHPSTPIGRRFREALGPVNEAVAAVADAVWLVVAGRVLALGASPWTP